MVLAGSPSDLGNVVVGFTVPPPPGKWNIAAITSPRAVATWSGAKLPVRYLYRDTVMPALRIQPISESQRVIAIVVMLAGEREGVGCRV
jgi:hypothetical protein